MAKLGVIIGSVREGRGGTAVANWFVERAKAHGAFDVSVLDLKEIALPIMNEPHHPRLKQYVHESTKAWSATVSAHDAFVFVTPEYNHSTPPAVINALATVALEWNYKVAGIVSYGGPSGGIRAQQMLKITLQALRMVVVMESVPLPFYTQLIDKETGVLKPNEMQEKGAVAMLEEMRKWTGPLESLRRS